MQFIKSGINPQKHEVLWIVSAKNQEYNTKVLKNHTPPIVFVYCYKIKLNLIVPSED